MKRETYQKFQDGLVPLRRAERELKDLLVALRVVGNLHLARTVAEVAAMVNEGQCLIYDGIGDACRDGLGDAEQSSANMLNAALAGIQLARMTPEEPQP